MRTPVAPKLRFEIFKRDKFTCQYCGVKGPDTALHVDHIDPVSKGGANEIINLITSCKKCNLGKSNRKLDDNSVVEKQRKQLELLQEKREQMELMVSWRKGLEKLDEEMIAKIADHINSKIKPYTLNNKVPEKIKSIFRKNSLEDVFKAIDISAETYLQFSVDGVVTEESADNFLNKIGGILIIKKLNPIQKKNLYIKGILKNIFSNIDTKTASILLNKYTAALKNYWDYEQKDILFDLEEKLIPKTRECGSWAEWKDLLGGWIENIETSEK